MAKFIYKMQNILNIKKELETQAKIAFSQTLGQLSSEKMKLKSLYDDMHRYEEDIKEMNSKRLIIPELIRLTNSIELKKEQIYEQNVVIKRCEREVELARKKLNDLMVERKTQEKLREKAFEKFLDEVSAQEKKEIDEVISFQFNKKEE